jgi:HNH endonuclease
MRASELKAPTDPATIKRFWASADKSGECWEWQKSLIFGYGQFNCQGKNVRAHRLAYALTHGCTPADTLVCHRCDNRRCVNPDHLFLGDYLINNRDMFAKGRGHVFDGTHILGTDNHNAKLDENKVREAIWLRSQGLSLKEISDRYCVENSAIWIILEGKTWQHSVPMTDNSWMNKQELSEAQSKWEVLESHRENKTAGAGNGNATLTDSAVMEVIWLRSQGVSTVELSTRYGVCKSTVKAILAGKLWKHITSRLIPNQAHGTNSGTGDHRRAA